MLLTVVGIIGYLQSRRAVVRHAAEHLTSLTRDHSHEVALWLSDRMRDVSFYASLPEVKELSSRMIRNPALADSLRLDEIFQVFYNVYEDYGPCGIYDLKGRPLVFAGECPGEETRSTMPPPRAEDLKPDEPAFQLLSCAITGGSIMRILQFINDADNRPVAILAFVLFPEKTLKDLLADYTGLGQTGEIYVVDADTVMLTPPRYLQPDENYHRKIRSTGISYCLAGNDSTGIYVGYRGVEVLGAYTWMPEQRWAMMVEISLTEALEPLNKIKSQFLLIGGLTLLFVLLISTLISRRITRPLYRLAAASDAIASGDLTVRIDSISTDEIGDLTTQFNAMVDSLNTSRRQIESSTLKLLQAEKLGAIGKLVASIVHEMRNPLSTVKMNLRIMEKRGELSDALNEHLLIARDQVARLERMLNELLEYSKPVQPDLAPVDIKSLIEQVSDDVVARLADKNVRLSRIIPDHPIVLTTDADLLNRIVDNILTNAIEASPEGSVISIEVVDNEDLRVVISDQGKGMSEKILNQIFEPFFTTRGDGIGLGMPNVKKFVEALESKIEVESQEGEGTIFSLTFPKNYHA
jgi:signal transduction histidine kinase